ncbi:MAG: dTDP-glucose 4,6-dehydratase [Planctomycetota bacterium]
MTRTILVTGGAGFIGSNFVQMLVEDRPDDRIVNLDALTYAGNLENLAGFEDSAGYTFVHGDIVVQEDVARAFDAAGESGVSHVVHFAAESHVDRSIQGGLPFVQANVIGTQVLLDESRKRGVERFVHVSTDEVYGSLGKTGFFTETTPLAPNSPYSASKAGSDMLVRAACHTHGFPGLITRCSNNYGPYQFPEKLIPLMIANAREGKKLPVYGDGMQIRDWLYVRDHCEAILAVASGAAPARRGGRTAGRIEREGGSRPTWAPPSLAAAPARAACWAPPRWVLPRWVLPRWVLPRWVLPSPAPAPPNRGGGPGPRRRDQPWRVPYWRS